MRRQAAAFVLMVAEVLNHRRQPPPSMVRDDVGAAVPRHNPPGPFGVGPVSPPLVT